MRKVIFLVLVGSLFTGCGYLPLPKLSPGERYILQYEQAQAIDEWESKRKGS